MKFFPNNTLTNFTTRLQTPIELGEVGAWEVGLAEIHFPRNWINVPKPKYSSTPKPGVATKDVFPPHPESFAMTVYMTPDWLMSATMFLEPGVYTKISEVTSQLNESLGGNGSITWDNVNKRVNVRVGKKKKLSSPKLWPMP